LEEALQVTQLITNIIIILMFFGILVVIIKLISTMKILSGKFDKISGDLKDLKPKVEVTIDKINSLSDNTNSLVTGINNNVHLVQSVVEKVKITVDSIVDFEQEVQKKIQPPVMETVNTIAAVSVGVKTFWDKMKSSKQKKNMDRISPEKLDELEVSIENVNKELDEVNSRLSDMQK